MISEHQKDSARARVRFAHEELVYHQEQAAASKAKIALLTRTWQLCDTEPCCGNPIACDLTKGAIHD